MVSLGQFLLTFGSSQVFVRFLPFFAVDDFTEALGVLFWVFGKVWLSFGQFLGVFAVDDFTEALGGPFLGFWKSETE